MSWYLAESLETFKAQINEKYPNRDKASDGTIGDESHSHTESDHNPNEYGAVCAIDITHDPNNGPDCMALAERIRQANDPRTAYVIWNKQIANPDIENWAWRPYTGKNPHTSHLHHSVRQDKELFDDPALWGGIVPISQGNPAPPLPKLVVGMVGDSVKVLQILLGIESDGVFGRVTEETVMDFQDAYGLVRDGVVGTYTWQALIEENTEE